MLQGAEEGGLADWQVGRGEGPERDRQYAGITSRESRPVIMFLPLWSTTHLSVWSSGRMSEHGSGTRVQGRHIGTQ